MLEGWTGCLLLASRDRAPLDRMDRIAELHRGEVQPYGGSFTEYEALHGNSPSGKFATPNRISLLDAKRSQRPAQAQ